MSREMLGFSIFERCPLIWKMENPLISTDALEQQLLVVVGTGAAPCPPYETVFAETWRGVTEHWAKRRQEGCTMEVAYKCVWWGGEISFKEKTKLLNFGECTGFECHAARCPMPYSWL